MTVNFTRIEKDKEDDQKNVDDWLKNADDLKRKLDEIKVNLKIFDEPTNDDDVEERQKIILNVRFLK